jgi:ribosomal protein L40E
MGKASRRKQEARNARKDTVELRYEEKRCLNCGARRDIRAVWCHECSLKGRRQAPARSWPVFKGPTFTQEQVNVLNHFPNDSRWDWTGFTQWDLTYYETGDDTVDHGTD